MKPINEAAVTFLSRSANEGFARTAEAVIRRDWNTKTSYDLASNVAVTDVG